MNSAYVCRQETHALCDTVKRGGGHRWQSVAFLVGRDARDGRWWQQRSVAVLLSVPASRYILVRPHSRPLTVVSKIHKHLSCNSDTYLRILRTGMRKDDPGSRTLSVTSNIGSRFGISIDDAITILRKLWELDHAPRYRKHKQLQRWYSASSSS